VLKRRQSGRNLALDLPKARLKNENTKKNIYLYIMEKRYNLKNENVTTSIYFNTNTSKNLDDIKLLLEENANIHVYPNSEDVTAENSYKNITDYIYRLVENTEFLCKGLNSDYILESFDKVDAVVVIGSSMNLLPNGNIFGFALIEFDEKNNSIYIDVICSHIGIKGAGDVLITTVEDMTRKLLMTEIYLTSVKTAIPFYNKYGFIKHDESCDNMCVMIKSINKKFGGKNKKSRKNTGKKSRIRKNKNKRTKKLLLK